VSEPEPGDWCGAVPGTFVDTVVTEFSRDAGGNLIEHVNFTSVSTATGTGKSIASGAHAARSTDPIDNGDGTTSFVTQITGLVLKFQIPNGPVLKAANVEPIRSAGVLTIEDVFDTATGNYITAIDSFHGPHLLRQAWTSADPRSRTCWIRKGESPRGLGVRRIGRGQRSPAALSNCPFQGCACSVDSSVDTGSEGER
jgi:hypothetical protein